MDKGQFEIEILPLYRRIYMMCLAMVSDADEAADAVQETFVVLWERRMQLDTVVSIESYARTIARNVCIKRLKSQRMSASLDKITEQADSSTESSEGTGHLLRLIKRLPDRQRIVMTLSAIGGCSNEEICRMTGDTPENVRQLLSRARKRFKELYNTQN